MVLQNNESAVHYQAAVWGDLAIVGSGSVAFYVMLVTSGLLLAAWAEASSSTLIEFSWLPLAAQNQLWKPALFVENNPKFLTRDKNQI